MNTTEIKITNAINALVVSDEERRAGEPVSVRQEADHAFGGKTSLVFQRALGKTLAARVTKMEPWQAALLVLVLGVQIGRFLAKGESLDQWMGGKG